MRYLVLVDYYYEGFSYNTYETFDEAVAFLAERSELSGFNTEDYQMFKIAQEYDVGPLIDEYNEKKETIKVNALGKLTMEEKLALGITIK